MSNFDTLTPVTAGRAGTAPILFCAGTPDDLVTITATGYLNDLAAERQVKINDIFFINYLATTSDLSTAILARFSVVLVGSDYDLVAFA